MTRQQLEHGWCLEIHDLVVSKLVAGREKDLTFAKDAARFGLLEESTVAERVAKTSIPAELRGLVEGRVSRLFAGSDEA